MALLEARGLTVRFGGHNAVNHVDLDVERGCVTGLIGPNGAGKTTIFNAITGLQEVSRGTLTLDGRDITRETPRDRARLGIARTFQQLEVFGSLSVRENILVAAEIRRRWAHDLGSNPTRRRRRHPRSSRPDRDRRRTGRRAPDRFRSPLRAGSRPRHAPSSAVARRARLRAGRSRDRDFAELLNALAADGIAVLLVEHDVALVMEVCASVHVIDYGAMVAVGTPAEIRRSQAVLDAYLGDGSTRRHAASLRTRASAQRSESQPSDDGERSAPPVLELRNITAAYGRIEVLHGIDLVLPRGNVVALLGPNGAGKSTMLSVASGQMTPSGGCIHLGGRHVNGVTGDALSRIGLCTIPEGMGVFPNLTVRENLVMASYLGLPLGPIEERTYVYFPRLKERRSQLAGTLSGGEQRMLALARALVTEPAALLLDEMSMGLAPLIVEELYGLVADIAESGVSILVVEQFAHIVLGVADFAVVLLQGRITAVGRPSDIEAELSSAYLGANS